MKKAKVLIAAIFGAAGIVAIKKLIFGLLLPLFMFLIVIGSNSSLISKDEIIDAVKQNSELISAAVYVIYSNNIESVYDAKINKPPEEIAGLDKYYIHIDEGFDMNTGNRKGRWEPLTDRNVIAVMDLDGVQRITKDKNIIKIDFGGRGIAPSGMSRGVYYLPNDTIDDVETICKGPFKPQINSGGPLKSDEVGYLSRAEGKTLYVERICANLWFYEETW